MNNEFTSSDEGSVLDVSNRYRYLQHNKRPAAVRKMKKVCKIDFREHICGQIMVSSTLCSYIKYCTCTHSFLYEHMIVKYIIIVKKTNILVMIACQQKSAVVIPALCKYKTSKFIYSYCRFFKTIDIL